MSANDTITTPDPTPSMTSVPTVSTTLSITTPSVSIDTTTISTSIDTPSSSTSSMSSSAQSPPTSISPSSSDPPPSSTPHPPSSTTQPPSSTTQPPSSTSEPPSSTPQPPSSTPEPPSSTPEPPSSTPEPPSSTPEPPSSTTPPPPTSSQPTDPSTSSSDPPFPPLTTMEPSTTLASPVFITITDNRGSLTSTAPRIVTLTSIYTNQHGVVATVTEVVANPTLIAYKTPSKDPVFFHNRGAVAAVFVLVGLATVCIFLWILFAVRRRRRTQQMEHDTAISASLAAAGFHRTPLYDDDEPGTTSHTRYSSPDAFPLQRRSSSGLATSSGPSAGRPSATYLDTAPVQPHADNDAHDYNPFFNSAEGYVSTPPPPSAFITGPYRDRSSTGTNGDLGGHRRHQSSSGSGSGSYEPLLASYYQRSVGTPPPPASTTIQRNTSQGYSELGIQPPGYSPQAGHSNLPPDTSSASSVYSTQTTGDDRLDPGLRRRLQDDTDSTRDLRDEEDYSRPVLGIRNLPNPLSQAPVP